jgi:hypothetical protein
VLRAREHIKKGWPHKAQFRFNATTVAELGHPGHDLHEDTEDMVAKEANGETSRVLGVGVPFS